MEKADKMKNADLMLHNDYAMYLRKSRADVELEKISHEETLARHKEMLVALAERNGIPMSKIDVYHEIVSGESIQDRPEMQKLLDAVYAGLYKAVFVVEVERLARGNTIDQGTVSEAFTASGTKIITVAKTYDPSNEFDQEYFEFGLFMSRREYKTIRRRLMAGKMQSIKEGNYIASADPYGYTSVRPNAKNRILVADPEQSKIIQMIFDWFVNENLSYRGIASKLTQMGIDTPTRGKADWSEKTIKHILSNPVYIGKVVIGLTQSKKVKDLETGKVVHKRVYNKNPDTYEGKHEGIISEELFYMAQDKIGTFPKNRKALPLTNPLATLLFCKKCGRPFVFHKYYINRKSRSRYNHASTMFCSSVSALASEVMEAVIDGLKAAIDDMEITYQTGTNTAELEKAEKEIEAVKAEIDKVIKAKKRLFDSYEQDEGIYTKQEFVERKLYYNERMKTLLESLEELQQKKPVAVDYEERIITLHKAIDLLRDESLPAEPKNVFLKDIISRIDMEVIDRGKRYGSYPVLDIYLK